MQAAMNPAFPNASSDFERFNPSLFGKTLPIGADTLKEDMQKKRIPFTCKTCGKQCECRPSEARQYCSPACAYASPERVEHIVPKERGNAVCAGCGAQFALTRTSGKGQYCSRACARRAIGVSTMAKNRRAQSPTSNKCAKCGATFPAAPSHHRKYCSQKCSCDDADLKTRRVVTMRTNGTSPKGYSRGSAAWIELGGKRLYARSRWEANYARYLEWLKQRGEIIEWEHEPHTFWFEKIKRGVRSYLPDFRVTLHAGIQWHEVKGWMDAKSKTKLKRMNKYYPRETVLVRDSAWFRANKTLAAIIPGWDSSKKRLNALKSKSTN